MKVNLIGHEDLTTDEFALHYIPKIKSALEEGAYFLVSDTGPTNLLFQDYLTGKTDKVTVYHMGDNPVLNKGNFPSDCGYDSKEEMVVSMMYSSDEDILWLRPDAPHDAVARTIKRRESYNKTKVKVEKELNRKAANEANKK